MKFDNDIKGLLKGVLTGCGILCLVEVVIGIVFCAAGLFNMKMAPGPLIGVILGSVGGTAVAMLVFLWMTVSLQKSLDKAALGGAAVKKGVQTGYTQRLLVQGIWVVAAIMIPFINTVCGLIPLLFPKLSIYLLQITGKLNLTQKSQASPASQPAASPQQAEETVLKAAEEETGDKGGET